MIRAYIEFLRRRTVPVVLALAVLTMFFGAGLWKLMGGDMRHPFERAWRGLRLNVDTSDDLFLASRDRELARYRESVEIFGDDRYLVALLEFDDVFTPENLAMIARVSDAVAQLPGAKRVTSVTHEPLYTGVGTALTGLRLSSRLPATMPAAQVARRSAMSNPMFVGHLISEDGRWASVVVRTWPHVRGASLDFLVRRFEQTVKMEVRGGPHPLSADRVRFAGQHLQTIELHRSTLGQMKRLLPLTALVMAAFLIVVLRSAFHVILILALMVLSLVWTFGFWGWLDLPITPIDVIIPTLLMTLATTYSLQFISRHLEWMARRKPVTTSARTECVFASADETFFPLGIAQITAAIGMISLVMTDIPAIRQFGVLSALGTLCTALLIYTILPLAAFLVPSSAASWSPAHAWVDRLGRASQWFYRHKLPTLILAIGLTLSMAWGIAFLKVENDPKSFFRKESPIRQAFAQVEQNLGGAMSLSVMVDGGQAGALRDPEMLTRIDALQAYVAGRPGVLKTLSFVDTLKRINLAMQADSGPVGTVPATREAVSQLLLLASFGDDPANFDRWVDYDYRRGRIEVRVANVGSRETLKIAEDIQKYIDDNWPHTVAGYVTGDHYMACRANTAILRGQLQGFAFTALAVFLVMWLCFGSPRIGLIAMVPNIAPVVAVLGIMGYMGVKIDMATALLASVALGIALDDTIHFIAHYMRNIRTQPKGHVAVREVVQGAGRAMVFTNVALALGFAVLIVSDFTPVRLFGWFMLLSMAIACFDDLVMMPSLVSWIQPVAIWDRMRIKFRTDVTRGIPLFAGLAESDVKKIVLMGRIIDLPPGHSLMVEGRVGEEMFVIIDGSVHVQKSGRTVASLARGETVGEMGVVTEHPRSADVVVAEPTTVVAFGYEALKRLESRYPRLAVRLLHNLSIILSNRLASTTALLR